MLSGQGLLKVAAGPQPRKVKGKPAHCQPWGSYPAAHAWPRAHASEPSSAGQEACRGLTRQDTETASPWPFPRPELPPLATSIHQVPRGGRGTCLLFPGESWSVLFFTSACGLCSHCPPPTHSIPDAGHPPAPGAAFPPTQGSYRAGTPDPQALCPGDPWLQTQPSLPVHCSAFCNKPLPGFPADTCAALSMY